MSLLDSVIAFGVSFVLLMVAMTVHEFAHGLVAYRLGDSTAKLSGRLTLNPLAHIDPFWTVILPLVLFLSTAGHFVFGAAKPVPVNYWSLKNPKRDMIWIGLAGPLANFILAFIIAGILKFIPQTGISESLFFNLLTINVVLAIFNLIPIPPLDGSKILMGLLPITLLFFGKRLEIWNLFLMNGLKIYQSYLNHHFDNLSTKMDISN